MTLPAHRYEQRKKKDKAQRTIVFDFDETITKAPDTLAPLAAAMRDAGYRIVVLTGNQSPHHELEDQLNEWEFPFDALIQYHDSESDGVVRAEYLKQLDAWCAVDNRIDRAPTYAKVCPHLFVVTEPTPVAKDDAKGTKKDAKAAAKAIRAAEHRGPPRIPPNYRPMDTPGESCGGCDMNDAGLCWGYGNVRIQADHVCDSFEPEQGSDAE